MGEVTIRMRAPGLAERLWCRKTGMPLPVATGHSGPWLSAWVRLLPYRWRRVHHGYAAAFGYFWLPCPLCGRHFGGHECAGSVPDPMNGPGRGIGICAPCTKARG